MPEEKSKLNVSAKSFVTALVVIFALMAGTYALTFVIPGGEYARVVDANGYTIVDTDAGFTFAQGGISFWKWLLSPILVLGSAESSMLIAIIAFLLVIGGIFSALEECGMMRYMLNCIVRRFAHTRYKLMAILTLFFMAMGSFIGSFEEVVPIVPIVVAMSVSFGWDAITGLAMSLLAAGCGFAAGVCNPFSVGVAQSLAGLPMFSGIWLRAVNFALIYTLLILFVRGHAKKVDKNKGGVPQLEDFERTPEMDLGLKLFGGILGTGIAIVLCSGFIKALQDYTMIIVAVMFLVAGLAATVAAKMKPSLFGKCFAKGILTMLPAVLMILMASSIKYTLVESKILDTILYYAVGVAQTLPKWLVILFIYLIVLVMNFFVASGTAKAFLLIPLIVPMAQIFGISSQLCVMAFAFGDGFSNVFYPTNAALLISLGLADVSYGKWAKWSLKFQGANLLLTAVMLLLGLAIGY